MNALDFEVVEGRTEEKRIGKEVQGTPEGRGRETPALERDHGKEAVNRTPERERERKYEPERGGMEM